MTMQPRAGRRWRSASSLGTHMKGSDVSHTWSDCTREYG